MFCFSNDSIYSFDIIWWQFIFKWYQIVIIILFFQTTPYVSLFDVMTYNFWMISGCNSFFSNNFIYYCNMMWRLSIFKRPWITLGLIWHDGLLFSNDLRLLWYDFFARLVRKKDNFISRMCLIKTLLKKIFLKDKNQAKKKIIHHSFPLFIYNIFQNEFCSSKNSNISLISIVLLVENFTK